ncbi:MAG: hypothetical protein JSW02_04995, partial [candidate division WOR-3 bacterium]
MRRLLLVALCCMIAPIALGWASITRTEILMAGSYIDDIVYIDQYPHLLLAYANFLYGDIKQELSGYGFIVSPEREYGAIGCWQNVQVGQGFNIAYAIKLMNFDIGISGSPVTDHYRIGIGIGRAFFSRRIDVSFLATDAIDEESIDLDARIAGRRGDFILMPKYTLTVMQEPSEYNRHRLVIMLQRLILNDGFVYFIAEYDFTRGDIANDLTHVHAGLDLPLNRTFGVLFGVKETFIDGFETPEWQV